MFLPSSDLWETDDSLLGLLLGSGFGAFTPPFVIIVSRKLTPDLISTDKREREKCAT